MTEIVHADIFFFITATAVIIIGLGMLIALYYVVLILRDVRAVAQKVRKASDELEQDFEIVRTEIKNGGLRVRTIFELVLGFIARQIPKARTKKKGMDE